MKKKVVGRGLIAALIAIAIILGVQYGTAWHTYRPALDFPEAAQASVVVSVLYSDQGQSVKLDERQREALFAQLKEEASFGGVDNQQDSDTSTTQEARVYSISIASKDSFALIMASKDSEQNCITGRDTVVKLKKLPKTVALLDSYCKTQ